MSAGLHRRLLKLGLWARRVRLSRRLTVALGILAVLLGAATYILLTGQGPIAPEATNVLILLNIDLLVLLALGAIVARRLVRLWADRRRGGAGSRLHVRLVVLFSLVAVTPAGLTALFSALFFNQGVTSWFNDTVRTAVTESYHVAQAYLREHQQTLSGDAAAMASDLARQWEGLSRNPGALQRFLSQQIGFRGLSEAMVVTGNGNILAYAGYSYSLQFEEVPIWSKEQAAQGEVVILPSDEDDRVRALVRVDPLANLFLFVGRFVDASVLAHVEEVEQAVNDYQKLEGERSGFEITFTLIFIVVTLLVLLAAISFGLILANRLARPLVALIDASEKVRGGDLAVRVPEIAAGDEISVLSRAFNRMTARISEQQRHLLETNRALDERTRFTETVLSGVSAGVIGLDRDGRITLPNRSAAELLAAAPDDLVGRALAEVAPDLAGLLSAAQARAQEKGDERSAGAPVSAEVALTRGGRRRTLRAVIAAERLETDGRGETIGFVLTFDDITDLQSAQRMAAWADVARRIAHEIKNPLTPIQLSAERLKRRYLKQIDDDGEVFVQCTDTIIRHVGDIGQMVDEFSAFARMPSPVMKPENLKDLVARAVVFQREAHPHIRFTTELPEAPLTLACDARQIGQVLTNLVKNAVEAIEGRDDTDPPPGWVGLSLERADGEIHLTVADNGRGLPENERSRLTEPYVTTRSKGTGLGLAIVKKILEDHRGRLILEDRPGGGARVRVVLPDNPPDSRGE
ncbi:sensor histidine kinase NtrY-like [Roseospirillum parvum]|uniref:Nitrogen regulation protein n=1 Tax=Roseospirillum parvum TaxID=83401 RepID=A0A1G7YA50_9PROT|nr:PAS domain-containing sensor histidine kinase [Roseospirillum parvum]SDG93229.1 two-component system, NtrC family, nitrogen regulation sensor histidine kinase NtrY [Roseospirillum parvum]